MIIQKRPKRKVSGGRYRKARKKRLADLGNVPTLTKVGKARIKTTRGRGGNLKQKALTADVANIYDPKTKKYSKAKILSVVDNPANRHYTRRNIMTKGTIIDTDKGKARVTSRPGQEGSVNAVLMQNE